MSPEINNWLQLTFRWLHVLAGVLVNYLKLTPKQTV